MNDDRETTLSELKELVLEFSRKRDWEQFHHPKDLGVALAIEVGELLEHFRYRTDAEIQEHLQSDEHRKEVAHEMADCFWLLLRLADVASIDLSSSLREKVLLADKKYPVSKVKGRPDKYTRYQQDERPSH